MPMVSVSSEARQIQRRCGRQRQRNGRLAGFVTRRQRGAGSGAPASRLDQAHGGSAVLDQALGHDLGDFAAALLQGVPAAGSQELAAPR
jgi:hypothetical protein